MKLGVDKVHIPNGYSKTINLRSDDSKYKSMRLNQQNIFQNIIKKLYI